MMWYTEMTYQNAVKNYRAIQHINMNYTVNKKVTVTVAKHTFLLKTWPLIISYQENEVAQTTKKIHNYFVTTATQPKAKAHMQNSSQHLKNKECYNAQSKRKNNISWQF